MARCPTVARTRKDETNTNFAHSTWPAESRIEFQARTEFNSKSVVVRESSSHILIPIPELHSKLCTQSMRSFSFLRVLYFQTILLLALTHTTLFYINAFSQTTELLTFVPAMYSLVFSCMQFARRTFGGKICRADFHSYTKCDHFSREKIRGILAIK